GPGLRVATGYRASRTRYCAFMEGDTAPGEPHSFPTRRSSDLELREYIANDYMPHARDTAGMAALPNGEAWYAFRAKNSTTTDLGPAQIHQIGLDEVARIHGEIRKVMAEVGFKGSLQDFFAFMQNDAQFSFESEEALLAHYRGLEDKINQKIPEL